MSYTQLAAARAISKESAIRLARRERWRKMPGNDADKTVRVLVPQTYLQPTARPDALPVTREDVPQGELSRLISMFETGLFALREQLAVANGRAEAAEQGRDGERQRADDAEADARELRAHAAVQLQLAEATAAAQAGEELRQADEARKARGLLARLRAAVRGR